MNQSANLNSVTEQTNIESINTDASPEPSLSVNDSIEVLDKYIFNSINPVVVSLNGCWGEGKTYFWRALIKEKNLSNKTGYISVFGAESITNIRERVISQALLASSSKWIQNIQQGLDKIKNSHTRIFSICNTVLTAIKRWPEYLKSIFRPESLSIKLLEENLIKPQWILCIDDIERLSDSIKIDELLGYINELKDEYCIKVVLIYSHDNLSRQHKEDFQKYQEKVIDRKIYFLPTTIDIVNFVFKEKFCFNSDKEFTNILTEKCEVLKLRNIRLLFKARMYFDEVVEALPNDVDSDLLKDKLLSILLFIYICYTKKGQEIFQSSEDLLKQSTINQMILAKHENKDESLPEHVELLKQYKYDYSDKMDEILFKFIQTGKLDIQRLKAEYNDHIEDKNKRSALQDISQVWAKYYHGTLNDNREEFCSELSSATRKCLEFIPVSTLDESLNKLCLLGKNDLAEEILNEYGQIFVSTNFMNSSSFPLKYVPLIEFLNKKSQEDNRPLNEVIESLLEYGSSEKDIKRIDSFSTTELINYFKSKSGSPVTSELRALRKHGVQSINEVAKRIADESLINKLRMQSMGLVRSDNS